MVDSPDDPTFMILCPNPDRHCGGTQEVRLLLLKDNPEFRFVCATCGFTTTLRADKIPGLAKALKALG